ncbi:MAG: 3-hydroxyacyl-ACP dehydratase FabZ [bacterium]
MGPEEISRLLPHRFPFLLVDRVLELDPEAVSIVAVKNVSHNEPFFSGHFPGRPVMPGVLILESLAQAGLLCLFGLELVEPDSEFYFVGVERARFRRIVTPGDQLRLDAKLIRSRGGYWKIECRASVEDEAATTCIITAIVQPPPKSP